MIRNTFYSIVSAIKNLWRNRMMSVASILSVSAALLILGLVFAIIINVNSFVEGAQDQFEEVTIFLQDDIDSEQKENLITNIKGIIGVSEVVYLSKQQAMLDWREEWGDKGYLLDGLDSNPLPDSVIITLRNLDISENVVSVLKTLPGIESIKFHKDVIDKIISTSRVIRTIGFVVILILLVIATAIITNTIKLAVNARWREINIMKYVGASNWFIRRPFIIEGTVLGVLGALVASAIIYFAYGYIYEYFTSEFYVLIAAHFVPIDAIMSDLIVLFVVLGVGIGALGSIKAMNKHLNV